MAPTRTPSSLLLSPFNIGKKHRREQSNNGIITYSIQNGVSHWKNYAYDDLGTQVYNSLIEGVPALVCDVCGGRIITEDTAREIERVATGTPIDSAPLYHFPQKVA